MYLLHKVHLLQCYPYSTPCLFGGRRLKGEEVQEDKTLSWIPPTALDAVHDLHPVGRVDHLAQMQPNKKRGVFSLPLLYYELPVE